MKRAFGTQRRTRALRFMAATPPLHVFKENASLTIQCNICIGVILQGAENFCTLYALYCFILLAAYLPRRASGTKRRTAKARPL